MNDPEAAWGEDGEDGRAVREPAIDFAWQEVESAIAGTADSSALSKAREEGGQAMLSALLTICAEGVGDIARRDQRASAIGVRMLCAAAMLRPGQVTDRRQRDIAALLGVTQARVSQTLRRIREIMARHALG